VGFLIAYPLYLVVTTSFRLGKTLDVLRLSALPAGLGNYATVLASEATWHSVGVTLVYLVGTIAPAFAMGLSCALLLNRVFPGRRASTARARGSASASSPGPASARRPRSVRFSTRSGRCASSTSSTSRRAAVPTAPPRRWRCVSTRKRLHSSVWAPHRRWAYRPVCSPRWSRSCRCG